MPTWLLIENGHTTSRLRTTADCFIGCLYVVRFGNASFVA